MMPIRPQILVILEFYLPGFLGGGTIRSLANLIEALGDEFDFKVLTRDRDWRSHVRYPGIDVHTWIDVGKAKVMYLPPDSWTFGKLGSLVRATPHDLMYLSSAFSPAATILPLILRRAGLIPCKPVIVGPRGEFSEGAVRIHKAKKRVYLAVAKCIGLFRGLRWQASTPLESSDIRREVGSAAEVIEAVDCSPSYTEWGFGVRPATKRTGAARICFVSRITPKKNLVGAIEHCAGLRGEVTFDVFGPIDNEAYWTRCKNAAALLPSNVKVEYRGAVPYDELGSVLTSYDLYVFPTFGENFGHSIVEALAAGCPVLISDRTPWKRLVARGVGWDFPLESPTLFRDAIQSVVDMDEDKHSRMRRRAREFALEVTDSRVARAENRKMFLTLLGANE